VSKRPKDPRGGHSRVYWEIQDSMAWLALGFSSVALYMALRRKLQSTNNGNIEATESALRHAGFKSPTTLSKGLRELQAVGLIDKTRQGGVALGRRVCSLYRFTDEAVFEHPRLGISKCPATNEWKKFITLAQAKKAISDAHESVKRPPTENESGLQNLHRTNTESVVDGDYSATDSVVDASLLDQKLFQSGKLRTAATPQPA